MATKVDLDIKEIYRLLCPQCQKKLEDLVKDKLASRLAKNVLQGNKK